MTTDYTDISIPSDKSFHMESEKKTINSDILWQDHLIQPDKEVLKENESKRPLEDADDDTPIKKKITTEFNKYWNTVMENPTDFQTWTVLLQFVDQSDELEHARKAYDSFFERYPNCYGYWKKYADIEKRNGTQESTLKVFERGLSAISLSADLWIHYLEYIMSLFVDKEECIREQFNRAVNALALEFRSDKLWDQFISFESYNKTPKYLMKAYDKLIQTPFSKLTYHWQKMQEFIQQNNPSELLSEDEMNKVKMGTVLVPGELPEEAPPGEDIPDSLHGGSDGNEERRLMKYILDSREKIYEKTNSDVRERWSFEDAIKRPYFHVKPLEKSQLNAWSSYLQYEIQKGNEKRIKVLFERCLIACAFYEEFWMKYIQYLELIKASEHELRSVYVKACNIHLRQQVRPRLAWAAFEEASGKPDGALIALKELMTDETFSLEAHMIAVGIHRRQGKLDQSEAVFAACLNKFDKEKNEQIYCFVLVKYARFLTIFTTKQDKAIELIKKASEKYPSNTTLLMALADQALSCRPPKFELAAETLKKGTSNHFPNSTRRIFANRYLHFMAECSTDATGVNNALKHLQEVINDTQITKEEVPAAEVPIPAVPVTTETTATTTVMESSEKPVNGASTTTTYPAQFPTQPYSYPSSYQQTNNYNQPYQSWSNYSGQPGSYAYGQGWGSYPNYYGQR